MVYTRAENQYRLTDREGASAAWAAGQVIALNDEADMAEWAETFGDAREGYLSQAMH